MIIETAIYGIKDITKNTDDLLSKLDITNREFVVKLVLTELIMNAHEHGNLSNSSEAINIQIEKKKDKLKIMVSDLGLTNKPSTVKDYISDEELLDESGRGLFIVNELSDELLIRENSITSIVCL